MRPKGSSSPLPHNAVKSLRESKFRVPDDASPEAAELAGYCIQRYVDLMAGIVPYRKSATVFKAAQALREEICGPVAQKVEVKGSLSLSDLVIAATQDEDKKRDG